MNVTANQLIIAAGVGDEQRHIDWFNESPSQLDKESS